MTNTVAAMLRRKGDSVVTIAPGATVFEAIGRMVENNVGALVVVRDGPVGIFTERDYLRRIALEGRTSRTTLVEEVMTSDLISVGPDAGAERCLELMTEHRIRHLPVLRDGELAGVVSIGDCVRTLLEGARDRADQLERFVGGGYVA